MSQNLSQIKFFKENRSQPLVKNSVSFDECFNCNIDM